jgi:hypothetical protein
VCGKKESLDSGEEGGDEENNKKVNMKNEMKGYKEWEERMKVEKIKKIGNKKRERKENE